MTAPLSAPSVRRRLAVVAVCSAAAALTAGCTAHMDMTISPTDTYDVVMEMRDTTGTVFTADTDCSAYADPALVGEFRGAQVSARAIGSVDDDAGVGCEVRVTGVAVPGASQATQGAGLVVHDGDLYVVDLTALASGLTGGGASGAAGGEDEDGAGGEDGASAGGAGPAGNGASGAGSGGAGAGSGATGSLNGVVDARVTVSFPGAVVDAGGGRVSGSSVTWTDPDVLAAGVRATGYATSNAGLSVWDRFSAWIIGGVVAVGIGVGAAAWRRRRAPSGSKDSSRSKSPSGSKDRSGPKGSPRSKSPSGSKGRKKGKGRRNR